MLKSIFSILLVSGVAFAAANDLSVKDFQDNDLFKYTYVEQAEKVFADELTGEDLYQVTYKVEGECASAGEFDACELVEYCEYVWVDQALSDDEIYMEGTQKDCSTDIEEIIQPIIIDEL